MIAGLAGAGTAASAFDLPGCGSDRTARANLTLDDGVRALLRQVDMLGDVPLRLVGHSIAGWLLPYAAAARPQVAELVFVAAAILERGGRGIDQIPADRRPSYFALAAASADNSIMPPYESLRARFFQDLAEDRAREIYARLTPQALGPYLTPAGVGIRDVATPRRYLALSEDRNFSPDLARAFAARARVTPEWITSDHCIMFSKPQELVAALT